MKKADEYMNDMLADEGYISVRLRKVIKQAQLDAIEYAVNKCAENAGVRMAQYEGEYIVDKQSILSTIDQIKEELK